MKPISRFHHKMLSLPAIFLVILFLWSCGGGPQQAQKRQLEEVKDNTELQLRQLRNDIAERIDYLDEQIDEATGETEEELKEARAVLKEQKELIDQCIVNVREATLEKWESVRGDTQKSYQDARSKMNEVSKNVREILDQE